MKRSKFLKTQIVTILKEAEAGVALENLIRQSGISQASFPQVESQVQLDIGQ